MAGWLYFALFCAAALLVSCGDGGSASGVVKGGDGGKGGSGGNATGVIEGGKGGADGSGGNAKGVIAGGDAGNGGGSGGDGKGVIAGGDAGGSNVIAESVLPGILDPTGRVIGSTFDDGERLLDTVFQFLFKSFRRLSYYELMEIIKYKGQSDGTQDALINYLASPIYATHRKALLREPAVQSILKERIEVDGQIVLAQEYYIYLKNFFGHILDSRPAKLVDNREGFNKVAVKNILDKISFGKAAPVFQQALVANLDFSRTMMTLEHLQQEQVDNLNAIRASTIYRRVRVYLSSKLELAALDTNLDNLFGGDFAIVVLVHVEPNSETPLQDQVVDSWPF